MKFALAIYGSHTNSQAPQTALKFAKAAFAQGHEIIRIFFYQDGVNTASQFSIFPQDEENSSLEWQALISEYSIDAVVCIAAALRRGVLDQNEAERYQVSNSNLAECYNLSGLGQLIDAAYKTDRLITFGS